MPKVSIIMPSLNVRAYIEECLDSVIRQTLQDIEVLCIDAGSDDGTQNILAEYAKKDLRIRVITSARRSYGYQMNLGLQEAAGEYIGIVETDDFILPEMYEELYACAKEYDADFVKSDFRVFTTLSDGNRLFLDYSLKKFSSVKYRTVFSSEDYILNKNTVDIFVWNGIYKKSFLNKNHILFQETPGAAFQDCGFRYQVALSVERGIFLDRSLYCYRRDNVDSSTYNSKCVSYNLAECKYLLQIAQKNGRDSRVQMEFLAREIAVVALKPYMDLLVWGQPAEDTGETLDEFRDILSRFIKSGVLNRMTVTEDAWTEIRMFVENPKFYEYYAYLKAECAAESIHIFLKRIGAKKQIILFGSGYVGTCAYCLIRVNGIQNAAAFCDNDKNKWGTTHMGLNVIPPEDAVTQFPDAYFVITNALHADEICMQLYGYGVDKQRIEVYNLSTSPMVCTNMGMHAFGMKS